MQEAESVPPKVPWQQVNKERATELELKADIILGDSERGLLVEEVAELLNLQHVSVRGYLVQPYRRADLFRRLFEQDESVTAAARDLVTRRRAGTLPPREKKKKPEVSHEHRYRMELRYRRDRL